MPKKTNKQVIEEVIIPRGETVETILENVEIDLTKEEKATGLLVAYAPFELNGEHYEPGDVFTPPADWQRDDSFEEFRAVSRKNSAGNEIGVAFVYPGEIIDRKTKERQYRRAVLPLKEA